MSAIEPRFPISNAWISDHEHEYIARDISSGLMQILARHLLEEDKAFQHLLRQCKDYWYISALVGQTTLILSIYVPFAYARVPDLPLTEPQSRKRAVFFRVTRDVELTEVDELTECRLRNSYPTSTSVRNLRTSEIESCRLLTRNNRSQRTRNCPIADPMLLVSTHPEFDLESGSPYRDIPSD